MNKIKRLIDGKTLLSIQIKQDNESIKPLAIIQNGKNGNIPTSLMEKEEIHEKHLQDAIKFRSAIPVPDIVQINDEDYDRLYPPNFKVPRIRVYTHPQEDQIDYDIDTEDEEWLNDNSNRLKLTPDNFERCMEFLENNCNNQVPNVNDLSAFHKKSKKTDQLNAIEATYDYWLNKRIQKSGRKLMFHLKREDKKGVTKKNYDPYVVFRPCREKMHLRKNRTRDCDNYTRMLEMKNRIQANCKQYRENLICERVKHEFLKLKFSTFEDQYRRNDFNYMNHTTASVYDTSLLLQDFKSKLNESETESEESTDHEDDQPFFFKRRSHCSYFAPKNASILDENSSEDDDDKKFHSTTSAFIRRRVGRGGRINIDRSFKQRPISPEYKEMKCLKSIEIENCKRRKMSFDASKTSTFCLHSTANNTKVCLNSFDFIMEYNQD